MAKFNRDDAARELGVDAGQLGRWFSGDENPQVYRFQQHPRLRKTLLVAQAEASGEDAVIVKTVIEVTRRSTERRSEVY